VERVDAAAALDVPPVRLADCDGELRATVPEVQFYGEPGMNAQALTEQRKFILW